MRTLIVLDEPIETDGNHYFSKYSWFGFAIKLLTHLGGGGIWVPLKHVTKSEKINEFIIPESIKVHGHHYYESFTDFFRSWPYWPQMKHDYISICRHYDSVIVRAPSQMSKLYSKTGKLVGKPLFTYYAGDFLQAAAPLQRRGASSILLKPIGHIIDYWQRELGRKSRSVFSVGNAVVERYGLPNAIVIPDSTIDAEDVRAGKLRPPVRSHPFQAIRLASYLPNKNYELLFEVFQALQHLGSALQIDCFGTIVDPEYYARLVQQAPPNVKLYPPLPAGKAVNQKLLDYDIQVICSKSEGIPRTILEGAAAGVALVTLEIGGIPSIVRDNLTAVIVSPKGTKLATQLAQAIFDLEGDDHRMTALITAGLALAESQTQDKIMKIIAQTISHEMSL